MTLTPIAEGDFTGIISKIEAALKEKNYNRPVNFSTGAIPLQWVIGMENLADCLFLSVSFILPGKWLDQLVILSKLIRETSGDGKYPWGVILDNSEVQMPIFRYGYRPIFEEIETIQPDTIIKKDWHESVLKLIREYEPDFDEQQLLNISWIKTIPGVQTIERIPTDLIELTFKIQSNGISKHSDELMEVIQEILQLNEKL